jgi:hypothetical protein
MAEIAVSRAPVAGGWLYTWTPLATGDTGQPISHTGAADMSVQFFGTFNSATIVLEGSLQDPAGTVDTYATLTDSGDNAISKTTAAMEAIASMAVTIRPSVSSGTATDLTCILFVRSTM